MTISALNYEMRSSAGWPWAKASLFLGAAATLVMCCDAAYSRWIVGLAALEVVQSSASGAPSAVVTAAYDHYSFLKIFAVAGFITMWFLSASGVVTGVVGLVKNSRRIVAVTGIILSVCPWLLVILTS